jgi:hypothetical protein
VKQGNGLRQAKHGGQFLKMHEHELEAVSSLPPWIRWLFAELILFSDFRTGAGRVTYDSLKASLTSMQTRYGPRNSVPDIQAIKKAIRKLESRLIVARDKAHSQAEHCLFYCLVPRMEEPRPRPRLEPLTRTPVDSPKASNGAAYSVLPH